MGWHIGETGFEIVLSPGIPALVQSKLRLAVDSFLREEGLSRRDITHWIAHTVGPKVLQAMAAALKIPRSSLERSWNSLASIGKSVVGIRLVRGGGLLGVKRCSFGSVRNDVVDEPRLLRRADPAAMVIKNV